jgi:hypothetical protein
MDLLMRLYVENRDSKRQEIPLEYVKAPRKIIELIKAFAPAAGKAPISGEGDTDNCLVAAVAHEHFSADIIV